MLRGKNPYRGKPKGSVITAAYCHCYCLSGSGSIRHALQTQKKHRISHVPCFDDVPYPPISIIIMVGSPIDAKSTGTRMCCDHFFAKSAVSGDCGDKIALLFHPQANETTHYELIFTESKFKCKYYELNF